MNDKDKIIELQDKVIKLQEELVLLRTAEYEKSAPNWYPVYPYYPNYPTYPSYPTYPPTYTWRGAVYTNGTQCGTGNITTTCCADIASKLAGDNKSWRDGFSSESPEARNG